ncbi:hypothetical protein Tco_1167718 [Tanacetum coccineum]
MIVKYDKFALWGISHWGKKRRQFYAFATSRESARDVYSKRRIIAVTKVEIVEWQDYKHLDWITVRRDDDVLYKFKEGDFHRLRIQDIEDMLLSRARKVEQIHQGRIDIKAKDKEVNESLGGLIGGRPLRGRPSLDPKMVMEGSLIPAGLTKIHIQMLIPTTNIKGHYESTNCPKVKNQNRGNKARVPKARGKSYVLGGGDANPGSYTVTGTFLLNDHHAYMLFDSGADRSFISKTFSALLDIKNFRNQHCA